MSLLEVKELHVGFRTGARGRVLEIVRGVAVSVGRGEFHALVGESGCGKSVTSMAITKLLPPDSAVYAGSVMFNGTDILRADKRALRKLRGKSGISYIFQDPMSAMNPVLRIETQLAESLPRALGRKRKAEEAARLLRMVGLTDAEKILRAYPCELSGGMAQRVCIAMAMAAEPALLIADEPTTALDVVTQKLILELLDDIRQNHGTAILLITHNLGLVARYAHTVSVMYAGCVIESGDAPEVLARPRHPYTAGLIAAVPGLDSESVADLQTIPGRVPNPSEWGDRCEFAPRCAFAEGCSGVNARPPLVRVSANHSVACANLSCG